MKTERFLEHHLSTWIQPCLKQSILGRCFNTWIYLGPEISP